MANYKVRTEKKQIIRGTYKFGSENLTEMLKKYIAADSTITEIYEKLNLEKIPVTMLHIEYGTETGSYIYVKVILNESDSEICSNVRVLLKQFFENGCI